MKSTKTGIIMRIGILGAIIGLTPFLRHTGAAYSSAKIATPKQQGSAFNISWLDPGKSSLDRVICSNNPALNPEALAGNIGFEFNTNGVLPSSQGATYSGSASETAAFSISGGVLHQDTVSQTYGATAAYQAGSFDHSLDATLEWRAKVYRNEGWAATIYLIDDAGKKTWDFNMAENGIYFIGAGDPLIIPMDTTNDFHNYKVVIPANSSSYQFYVDGVLRFSSNLIRQDAAGPGGIFWGDGTYDFGNARVDWDYVRLTNSSYAAR